MSCSLQGSTACSDHAKSAPNEAEESSSHNIKAATQVRQSQPCSDQADSTDSFCLSIPGLTSQKRGYELRSAHLAAQQLALRSPSAMLGLPLRPHLTPAPIWAERAASPPVKAAPPRQVVDGSAAPADEVLLQERRC